ncbi:hypothetical protein PILCRDRAFT_272352 [Piloderma croceum F 1598]|uniref:Uncharacterized protein n=1 Tax=Piloderma croceum (strain F 1598) TaxID=765440 RepID=A0A0C3CCC5_PILCF|nr:hypothetical protein PILCRDRAFT_272352 [Piloderma croceum F 1598]
MNCAVDRTFVNFSSKHGPRQRCQSDFLSGRHTSMLLPSFLCVVVLGCLGFWLALARFFIAVGRTLS